jgi:hypothetical protein
LFATGKTEGKKWIFLWSLILSFSWGTAFWMFWEKLKQVLAWSCFIPYRTHSWSGGGEKTEIVSLQTNKISNLLTDCQTNKQTPWSRVLPEKLTGPQLVKYFPAFYGTRRYITAFTRPRHLSISWARSIQSVPPYPTSWTHILIFSSNLRPGLRNGLPSFPLSWINFYSDGPVARDSLVGIPAPYWLDGPGIESRWWRDISRPSWSALGPTQPPIQLVLGFLRG